MTLLDKLYLYKPSDVINRGPPFTSLIIEKSKHHKQTVPDSERGNCRDLCKDYTCDEMMGVLRNLDCS